MRRLLILLSVGVGVTWGQGAPPTVTQIILTNATTTPQLVTVNNQGQTVHSVTVALTDAPAQTCGSTPTLSLVLEGGNDGITYFPILSIVQTNIAGDSATITRNAIGGPFSFLRVNVQNFPTATCLLSVGYTGAFGGSGAGAFNPNLSGMKQYTASVSTGTGAGGSLIAAIPPAVQGGTALYGFIFINYGTSAETITVAGDVNACSGTGSTPFLINAKTIPPGNTTPQVLQFSPAGLPYLFMPRTGNALCLIYGATAATHNFYAYALWRYE